MKEWLTAVDNVECVDMARDPVVARYVELAASLGERWGEVVVLDQHGTVVLGRRRLDRALREHHVHVPTVRIETGPDEARLLRLAEFCDGGGLFVAQIENLIGALTEVAG